MKLPSGAGSIPSSPYLNGNLAKVVYRGEVISRRSMTDEVELRLKDQVKVKATEAVGFVEQIHNGVGKYWVEFNRDFATRAWFTREELEFISRQEDSRGPRFVIDRPIM
jgi:hypothetical protein